MNLSTIFNSRELACIIWALILLACIAFPKKMVEVRQSFRGVFKALLHVKIITPIILMVSYVSLCAYLLNLINLWEWQHAKSTIIWCVSVGFVSIFKLESAEKDPSFFMKNAVDCFKITAMLQFVIEFYTFPLIAEIIMLPILAFLGVITAFVDTDEQYAILKKPLNGILTVIGFSLIVHTVHRLFVDYGDIAKPDTVQDFLIMPLLGLMYLPFIYVLLLYSVYKTAFIRLKFGIHNPAIRRCAKLYAVLYFNVRYKPFKRWSQNVIRQHISTHHELMESFCYMSRVTKAERKPPIVNIDDGWSPYEARYYLKSHELDAGYYDEICGEWGAVSNTVSFGKGRIESDLSYYIDGNESSTSKLKVNLHINDSEQASEDRILFLNAINTLIGKSLGQKRIPKQMEEKIISEECFTERYMDKTLHYEKEAYDNHLLGGYRLSFSISN